MCVTCLVWFFSFSFFLLDHVEVMIAKVMCINVQRWYLGAEQGGGSLSNVFVEPRFSLHMTFCFLVVHTIHLLHATLCVVQGITLDEFRQFCQFLNNLDDFSLTMKMYTYAQKSVSQGRSHCYCCVSPLVQTPFFYQG